MTVAAGLPGQIFDPDRLAAVRRTGLLDTAPEEAFDRLTRLAATLLGTPFAFVTVVDDQRSFWKSRSGVTGPTRQNTVQQSFCRYVVASGAELIVPDARTDPRTADNPSIEVMGVAAWAGFPVRSPDGHVLGTFCAVDTATRDWTAQDVEILRTLAQAAAGEIALRQAVNDAQTATARAEQLADTLQQSLLPPHLPDILGVEVAVRYRRAAVGQADVYGDFYDVFPSVRDAWSIVVGDVAGKGPQAAKVTALARYTLRAAAVRSATPSTNLATLNAALLGWYTDDPRFLTAVYATLRPHRAGISVRICCGGHDPALIRRADGRVEPLGRHGLLLGWRAETMLSDQRTILHPGDSMVLFTDGVTEGRRPSDRVLFGPDRLREVIADTLAGSADRLAAAVHDAVAAFTGGRFADDAAVLTVHVPAGG